MGRVVLGKGGLQAYLEPSLRTDWTKSMAEQLATRCECFASQVQRAMRRSTRVDGTKSTRRRDGTGHRRAWGPKLALAPFSPTSAANLTSPSPARQTPATVRRRASVAVPPSPAMAQIQETPLDERQWRSPLALSNLQFFGGLHSKTVHMYFMESDFFDRTSNNWALFMQHRGEPWLVDRHQFEMRLRSMQGLEFMVVAEPEPRPDGTDTGIYVFRKQQRRKRAGNEEDITVLGTYYVIGENIYQAASLEDIIGNKIVFLPLTFMSLLCFVSVSYIKC